MQIDQSIKMVQVMALRMDPPVVLDVSRPLREVVHRMRDENAGCAVITHKGHPVSIRVHLKPDLHPQAHDQGIVKTVSGWLDVLDVRPEIQPWCHRVVVEEFNGSLIVNFGRGMNWVPQHIT